MAVKLTQPLYAFDSTTMALCLSLFPWADFRKTKAAVKMHTLIDLRGPIPTWVAITTGKVHDVRMLDRLPIEKEAFYAMDRGYIDFFRLYAIHQVLRSTCSRKSSFHPWLRKLLSKIPTMPKATAEFI